MLKRLTIRNSDGTCSQPTNFNWSEALNKLADYEDTFLTPEEIKSAFNEDAIIKLRAQALGVSADRLRELAAADRDGRVVALPCKVGDLLSKLEKLQNSAADAAETYTTGYRYGHRNGQAELIRYILGIGDGSVAEAEAALKGGDTDV